MIIDIGNIIIDKVKNLPFIDKYAGVVKVITYNQPTDDGKVLKKIFPVSCRLSQEDCVTSGQHLDLCPDSKKKSVLYLEDKYVRFIKRDGDIFYFQASFDLICWLNIPLLGLSDCTISSKAILSTINSLVSQPFNSSIYQRVSISPLGEEGKTRNPFAKYTYDETINQFLMHPYDYFILPINVDFAINKKCINDFEVGAPIGCYTPAEGCCNEIPVSSPAINCETLPNCQTIIDIIERIEALEEASGGSSFDCSELAGCQTIVDIQQSIADETAARITADQNLQNQIDNLPTNTLAEVLAIGNTTNEKVIQSNDEYSQLAVFNSYISGTNKLENIYGSFYNGWYVDGSEAYLKWSNGAKLGQLNLNATRTKLEHTDLIELTAPSVTKNGYEIATENFVDQRLQSNIKIIGDWDATSGSMPLDDESNTTPFITQWGAVIKVGWAFRVGYGQAGTVGGFDYEEGDVVYALIDNAGATPADWGDLDHNLQQATESLRGTGKVVTNAIIDDETTSDNERFVTANKLWSRFWARVLAITHTFAAKITFTTAPRLSSTTASTPLAVDSNKDVISLTDSIWGSWMDALTGKTTPVDADGITIKDSADSNKAKFLSFTNLKAFLKTYFDTIYRAINEPQLIFSGSFAATTLAANVIYYFSNMNGLSAIGTQSFSKFGFDKNRKITKVVLLCSQNTNYGAFDTKLYIRKNATTDYTITETLDLSTVGLNSSKVFYYTVDIDVTTGDNYEFKIVTPATTGGTNSRWHIQLYGY